MLPVSVGFFWVITLTQWSVIATQLLAVVPLRGGFGGVSFNPAPLGANEMGVLVLILLMCFLPVRVVVLVVA